MARFFITATGTGVGKTFLTTALVHQWRAAGQRVTAFKPVISGFDPQQAAESDSALLLKALGRPLSNDTLDAISPWRFAAPLSPNIAAAREGRTIEFDALVAWCREALALAADNSLIEGVGGALVPIDDRHLVADWIAALDIPFILVTGSYLGTISHTLATLEALAARRLAPAAIVVSESAESPMPLAETIDEIARLAEMPRVLALPRASDWQTVGPLVNILCKN